MAEFTNVSGEDREVYLDGTYVFVEAGSVFTVPDELAPSLKDQPHFAEVVTKKAAKAAIDEGNI